MIDDLGDGAQEARRLRKRVERQIAGGNEGGDSSHAGSGTNSLLLGDDAIATGSYATAVGPDSEATDDECSAFGNGAYAFGPNSTAVGDSAYAGDQDGTALGHVARSLHSHSTAIGADSQTTASNQVRLGTASDTVSVPGTFSNPSARHLKQYIKPVPCMVSIFPAIYEWEYIAAPGIRRIGPMADDLLGTDGERFLTFDDEGRVSGINKVDLHTAQIAALLARVMELEKKVGGCSCG